MNRSQAVISIVLVAGAIVSLLVAPLRAQDLAKDLKSKEWGQRKAAVELLSRDKDPKSEKLLIGVLKDDDWELVEMAATGLGERGAKGALDALVKLSLDGPVFRVRRAAAIAAGKIDAKGAAGDLVKKVAGENAPRALEALAILLNAEGLELEVKAFVKLAEKPKEITTTRAAAARAAVAGAAGTRADVLAKFLASSDVLVACAAIDEMRVKPHAGDLEIVLKALAQPKLNDVVERRLARTAKVAIEAKELALEPAQVLAQLAPLLASKDGAVSARAARLLGPLLGPVPGQAPEKGAEPVPSRFEAQAALDALRPALESADARARASAVHALARLGGDEAARRARSLASGDKDARVRWHALATLADISPLSTDENQKVVFGLLSSDVDAEVRILAATLCGRKGFDVALAPLTAALTDKDWSVGACAAVSLGKTQNGSAIDVLAKLSKSSPDWKLRGAAVVGLTRLYQKTAIPHVIAALADSEPSVVKCAHVQLIAIAREKFPPKVEPWNAWWAKEGGQLILLDPEKQAEVRQRSGSDTAAASVFRDLDLVVLESRGDHIEKVLDGEKIEYRRTMASKVGETGLTPDGMFVANCTGEIEAPDVERLRWFVLTGGHLFGSCWALHETIERALPGVLKKFETQGEVLARVPAEDCSDKNPILAGVFGDGVRPIYVLEGAHLIEIVDPERADVLLDSPYTAQTFGSGNLAAWFSEGHGTVLDSVNHFEEQGLGNAEGLKTPKDRQAYAVDHMGLGYDKLRETQGEKFWDNSLKAGEKILDLSVFRLITNLVRVRRKAMQDG